MALHKSKRVPSIFNDESTESFICLRRHIYMSHVNKVQPIRVKMMYIAAIRVTCMKDLVSVVKILLKAFFFCSQFPYPPTTRASTRADVKRMKDNEMRHVIHDTRISSGQCPRRDVTYGTVRLTRSHEYTPALDIEMSTGAEFTICTERSDTHFMYIRSV
jgi:hypothetical protein